jgi:Cys-rich protein (TIGR01571 family)
MPHNTPFDFCSRNGYDQGFFECFMDPIYCLATCFCPCLIVGKTKGELDGGQFDILSCLCMPIGAYRNRRRIQDLYNHHETEDGTMCAVVCCTCCAVTQDAHELCVRQPAGEVASSAQAPASASAPTA